MVAPDIHALIADAERFIRSSEARMESSRDDEYVGVAADEMVTATVTQDDLRIGIHVLAKRRMSREELAAAIVEAVRDAEHQASDAGLAFLDTEPEIELTNPELRTRLVEIMRQVRQHLAR